MVVGAIFGLALRSPRFTGQGAAARVYAGILQTTRQIDVALWWIVSQITTEYPTEVALVANALIGRKSGNLSIRGIPD